MRILFKDAYLISPDVELEGASVLVENGVIRHVYACGDTLPEKVDRTVMLRGDMLVPGFADIHTHGRGGQDFCYGTENAIKTIAEGKLKENRRVKDEVRKTRNFPCPGGSPAGRKPGRDAGGGGRGIGGGSSGHAWLGWWQATFG